MTVLLVATFMDLLDVNIVTVAIPAVQHDLGASTVTVQAVTAGYTLSFAVVLITGGRLGDIFGRKRMFMAGVTGFVVASALCAAAQSSEMLVAARILQGVAAAVMVPQVLAVIHVTFDPREIGRVVSLYAGMIGLAIVAAPVLGGVLVDADPLNLGWRSVFVVNLPVGAAALIGAWKWMRESKPPYATRLDLIGVLLAIVGLLLLMFPLMLGRELDWPAWSIVCLAGAGPAMVGFVFYERFKTRRDGSSLVILSLFQVRAFSIGVFAQLLFSAVPAGFFLSWTLYLQGGLGWSALHTGLTAIPFSLGVPIVGTVAVRTLFPRFGRYSLVAGALMMILGVASYAWVAEHAGEGVTSWHVAPSMLLLGSGMGLLMAPLTGLILREVTPQEAGAASGVINTVGQLGAALGVAIIGGVFFSALAGSAGQQADKVISSVRAVAPAPAAALRTCATDQLGQADLTKVPASCATLLASGQDSSWNSGAGRQVIDTTLSEIRSKTFIVAYSRALYWASGALVLIAGLLFLLPHRVHRPGPTASTPGEAS